MQTAVLAAAARGERSPRRRRPRERAGKAAATTGREQARQRRPRESAGTAAAAADWQRRRPRERERERETQVGFGKMTARSRFGAGSKQGWEIF